MRLHRSAVSLFATQLKTGEPIIKSMSPQSTRPHFRVRRLPIVCAFMILLSAAAEGQTPLSNAFTYQGQLNDVGNLANGMYDLRFRLYDALAAGAQVGATVCVDNVNVTDGLFTVPLDFGAQFAGQQRFLEIDVRADTGLDCANPAGFVPLTPRQLLSAAPNALFAVNADLFDGLDSTAFLQSIPLPLTLSGTSTGQIIRAENDTTASGAASVVGLATGASGSVSGVSGQSASISGRGVVGLASAATGGTIGGQFQSNSTSGRGVYGSATAASGVNYGVYAESTSASGHGVYGLAAATAGLNYGVYGQTESNSGRGVYGYASAASGFTYGGRFESESTSGHGVFGRATATTGETAGGRFECLSTAGTGVFGFASAPTGATDGVYGFNSSTDGRGVFGEADANSGTNYGVYGLTDSTTGRGVYGTCSATGAGDTPYGVRGVCSAATFGAAVAAVGDSVASGTKSFRIDHPADPENKYLLHYSAESPEVINFYSGTIALDARGEATVELPTYFAGINKDPRYTLTAVGAAMPSLHIADEISAAALKAGEAAGPGVAPPTCSFRIAGGVAGGKVSWRVEAVRNDLRMRLHGAPVEREKTGPERGKYQHPEYYGQPPEKGMDYDERRHRISTPPDSDSMPD